MLQWKKNLYVLFGAELLAVAGMMMIQPFLTLYIEELDRSFGSTELWAGLVYSLQAGMMLLTAPIWGAIADRYGRKVMVQRSMLGGAVIIGLMGLRRAANFAAHDPGRGHRRHTGLAGADCRFRTARA